MSTESAKKFIKQMMEDKVFAAAMEKVDNKEERMAFVEQAGFDFSREELTGAVAELTTVDVAGSDCCGLTCERELAVKMMTKIDMDVWDQQVKWYTWRARNGV